MPIDQQRHPAEVAAAEARLAAVAGAEQRAADQPEAVGADEQGEAGLAARRARAGRARARDVHRRRPRARPRRSAHQCADDGIADDGADAGARVAPSGSCSARRRRVTCPRSRTSSPAEIAKVMALRPSTSSGPPAGAGRRRRPGRAAGRRRGPAVERVGGRQPRAVDQRGQQRGRRGPEQGVADAGTQRERHDDAMPSQRRPAIATRAHVARDRAAQAAGAVDEAAEQRAEQHRGHQVGQQHGGRRPGRADPLVRDDHQRDIAGAGAQPALEVGDEEPADRRSGEGGRLRIQLSFLMSVPGKRGDGGYGSRPLATSRLRAG